MTAIAARKSTRTMAADSQMEVDDMKTRGDKKIVRVDGWLYGITGKSCPPAKALIKWIASKKGDESRKPWPRYNFNLLTLSPEGNMYLLGNNGDMEEIHEDYWGVGSGGAVAIGVLYQGGTPEEAIQAACKHSTGVGGPIQVEVLDGRPGD